VPLLVKEESGEPASCENPISIMLEIAKCAYLDEILFAPSTSKERQEIFSFIELAQRMPAEDLAQHVN